MFNSKWMSGFVVALTLLMVFQIPMGGASAVSGNTRDDLILNVAIQENIMSMNPLAENDLWTWKVIGWVLDGLVWRNNTNNDHIEPWAAEWFHHGPESTWDTSVGYPDNDNNDDYRNWTVKLRDGIKWHDWQSQSGDDMYVRAHDVVFSLRLMADVPRYMGDIDCLVARNPNGTIMYGRDLPANGTIRLISWDGENVKELPYWIDLSSQKQYPDLPVVYVRRDSDDLTLHYYLAYPYADFEWSTLTLPTFPERIWKNHIEDKRTWDSPECLINFGPFRFVNWNFTSGTGMLRTFRDYFHTEYDERGNPKPYIDGINFRVYKNTDAALQALQSDEIDYIAWSIDPSYIDEINADPNLTLVRNSDLGFYYLAFNMRLPYMGYANYSFEDVRNGKVEYNGNYTDIGKPFRVAMAHITDKQTIVQRYLQGFGTVGTSVVPPANTFWYNSNVTTYSYDPDKANEILDKAGYNDTDGDGWRELPIIGEDQITIMETPPPYDPPRCMRPYTSGGLIASIAQAKARLNVKSVPVQFGTIVDTISNQDFQMYILGWSIPTPMSSATAPCDFFASMNDAVNGGDNYPGYHNRSFDELCHRFMRELNFEKRRELSYQMQETIAEDVPYVVLYYQDVLEAYNNRLWGWIPRYGTIFNMYSLMNLRENPCPYPWELSSSLPSKITSGVPVELTAYLYNKDTLAPISGVDVSFKIKVGKESNYSFDKSALTDSSGKASVTYTPPVVENQTTITVEISVNDVYSDTVIKKINIIVLLPAPPPEYEIGIKMYGITPNHILAVESDNPIPVRIQVINTFSNEPLGELENWSGVNISVIISPAKGASFEYRNYSNGTFNYIFVGHADPETSVTYFVRITATYIHDNFSISAADDQISFTVVGNSSIIVDYPPYEPKQSIEPYIAISAIALIIVAAAIFVFFWRSKGKHF